jgi:hypothetical protein
MVKSLITALAFGAFAITGVTGPAAALVKYKPCYSAPKSGIPCTLILQAPQPPKPQGN